MNIINSKIFSDLFFCRHVYNHNSTNPLNCHFLFLSHIPSILSPFPLALSSTLRLPTPIHPIIHIPLLRRLRPIKRTPIILTQFPSLSQPLRKVWIRNEPPPEDYEVGCAGGYGGEGVEPGVGAGGEEGDGR